MKNSQTMSIVRVFFLCLCWFSPRSWSSIGDSWNTSVDWHCEGGNPDNNWTYGCKTGPTSAFTHYDWSTCGGQPYPYYSYWTYSSPWGTAGFVHKNMQNSAWNEFGAHWEPRQTTLWAGSDSSKKPAFRWTAPEDGQYNVNVLFTGNGITGSSCDIYVVARNTDILTSGNINGYYYDGNIQSTDYLSYSGTLSLFAGDTLDFIAGDGGNGAGADLIGIDATITQTGIFERFCGDAHTVYLPGDMNTDCYVNIKDMACLASEWLSSYDSDNLQIIILTWLSCTDPANDNCVIQASSGVERAYADQWISEKISGPAPNPPFSLTYNGVPSSTFLSSCSFSRTSEQLDSDRTKWTLQYTHASTDLIITCEAIEYHDHPAVEWVLKLRNSGASDTPILQNIQTANFDVTTESSDNFMLYHARGSQELNSYMSDFEPLETPISPGTGVTLVPNGGRSSDGVLPYFNLAKPGYGGYMFAVGWSGQWKANFNRSASTTLNIQAGLEESYFRLYPNESVRMPAVFLTFWSGSDRMRGQNQLRQFILDHYTPREGPISANPHAAYGYSDVDAAKAIQGINNINTKNLHQIEIWGIDAGWYENSGGTTGWQETGDWDPDPIRYPNGIKPVADAVHAVGRKFSLWFEPERVQSSTDFWTFANSQGWLIGSNTYHRMLNMGNSSARAFITYKISNMISSDGIDVYRHDFNFPNPVNDWRANDSTNRKGITELQYIAGLYDYFDTLLSENPGIFIDGCASGGRRLDFEMMRRSLPLWRSDILYNSLEGIQAHTYGLSFWLPVHGYCSIWTDTYNFRSCMGGSFILALYDFYNLSSPSWTAASNLLNQLLGIKHLYTGDYYPLTAYSTTNNVWMAWQFHRSDLNEGMFQAFRRTASTVASQNLKLHSLDELATYDLTCVGDSCSHIYRTGQFLMENGLDMTISFVPGSLIIKYTKVN